jgi:hypothetical protein
MAREDVNIKVSANVAEAIRLWKAMEEGPKAMANQLDAMGGKGQKSVKGLNDELGAMVGQWASIGAAIEAARKILEAYMKTQRELRELESNATHTADKASRELANLAPSSKALGQIRNDMLDLAIRRRVTPERAKEAAAALLGAGYNYDDVMKKGGAGDAALRTLAATNAAGGNVDAKSMVDAMTGFLDATSQEKNSANLVAAGQAAQAMFATNKLEIADLQALAPRAANIFATTGLKNEQIAIMSQFKDVTTADIGATAFHGAVNRLGGAGNNRARSRALAELGLTPADVDFQGESFFDVQSRLAGAFERAGPNADRLKQALFGDEAKLAGNVLFSSQGAALTRRRLAESKDASGFDRAANITEGSLEAKGNAITSEGVKSFFTEDFVDPTIARQALMSRIQKAGGGAGYQLLGTTAFDIASGLGFDANTATRTAVDWVGGNDQMAKEIINKAQADTVKVHVDFTVRDQNAVAIPHSSPVINVGKNKAPKER